MENYINKVIQGDCLIKLKELEDNSVDSIVTDPPYELGFMGKSWDNTGIANNKEMWAECLSPNYWNDATGNKHYFFMLENAMNPEPIS